MAEKKEADSEEKKDEGKKGNKKLIIIIAVVVLLVVVGGVGAFLALGKAKPQSEDGEDGGDGAAEEEVADEGDSGEHGPLPGAVLPLESFIVNLQVKGSFLKTTMQLEFATPALPHNVDREVPKIRDAIIRIISSKAAADILSAEGKEKMRDEVKRAVNEALKSEDVTNIYITEFIIQ